jgi:hypothetical protein
MYINYSVVKNINDKLNQAKKIDKYKASYDEAKRLEDIGEKISLKIIKDKYEICEFVNDVMCWKVRGIKVDNLQNADEFDHYKILQAISAIESSNGCSSERFQHDRDAILNIMSIPNLGYKSGTSKVASAVLRFLDPKSWGVVDWRNAVMIKSFDLSEWKFCDAIEHYKMLTRCHECHKEHPKNLYKIISPYEAVGMNNLYRHISASYPLLFPKASDVDMAIFACTLLTT